MRIWSDNTSSIEAIASTITALVAILALVGVKFQIDETARLQSIQSARDSFRAHLSLAASHPHFARPEDACTLLQSDQGGGYEAFIDHLLYSAEQMLAIEEGWQITFLNELSPHTDYLCSESAPLGETAEMSILLTTFRDDSCPEKPAC